MENTMFIPSSAHGRRAGMPILVSLRSAVFLVCAAGSLIVGCSLFQTQSAADFSQFRAAQKLTLGDRGPDSDGNVQVKRSADVSDAHAIAEVTALLAAAKDWKEVPLSRPSLRFTLWATGPTEVADWASFQPMADPRQGICVQKNELYSYISIETFQRLLTIFGAAGWLENPPAGYIGQGAAAVPPRRQ